MLHISHPLSIAVIFVRRASTAQIVDAVPYLAGVMIWRSWELKRETGSLNAKLGA